MCKGGMGVRRKMKKRVKMSKNTTEVKETRIEGV